MSDDFNHRHLDADVFHPSPEAVLSIIERGDDATQIELLRRVRKNPDGDLAAAVAKACQGREAEPLAILLLAAVGRPVRDIVDLERLSEMQRQYVRHQDALLDGDEALRRAHRIMFGQ